MSNFEIGMVGLSVMGRSLALNMADHGFRVAAYNRSAQVTKAVLREFPHENLVAFYRLEELVQALARPRKVFLMIQAGPPVDAVLDQLCPLLGPGDIVLDGGNSYFEDTRRRAARLAEAGLSYMGVGVSGGEAGARFGPSIMPGGSREAYAAVRPILERIAAKAGGEPCCAYMGPEGAGHYVKMVHNGIEYADMQLIAEAYLLLKYSGGFSNAALAETFSRWDGGELHSYLIGITADIFRRQDDLAPGELVDHIQDSAEQKGTGRWAGIEALRQGVDISMITAACNARVMSGQLAWRKRAAALFPGSGQTQAGDMAAFARRVEEALYAGKIIAYAQGFSLLSDASVRFGWELDLGRIAGIFRAGCIIRAAFLEDITRAYEAEAGLGHLLLDDFFSDKLRRYQGSLRHAVSTAALGGLPAPALANAVAYLDAFRAGAMGANLIQAQRDCFGAHTFLRTDRPGKFHREWGREAR